VFYVLSGFYSVGVDQKGYVTRFGELSEDNVGSGMHYHLPWPIEKAIVFDTPSLKSAVIKFSEAPEVGNVGKDTAKPLELITGDGNLVEAEIEVQYSVSETMRFATSTVSADSIIKSLAKAELIYSVSSNQFESILTTGRNAFQERIKTNLQQTSIALDLGVRITGVQIKLLEPPRSIKKAFDDVSSAQSEKQKVIQEAKGERGARLARARSESNRVLSNARATSDEVTKRAQGDVQRFNTELSALGGSESLLVEKLYLETLEELLEQTEVIIIAPES